MTKLTQSPIHQQGTSLPTLPSTQQMQGTTPAQTVAPATTQTSAPAGMPHQVDAFQQGTSDAEFPRITPGPAQQSRPNPQMLAFDLAIQGSQNAQGVGGYTPTAQSNQRPEVAALLDTYDVQTPLGRPQERILRWAAELHNMLKTPGAGSAGGADLDATIDKVVQRDARRMVFFLQGALKIYRKEYPALETHYRAAKQLEDVLGNYSRWNNMAGQCKTHGLPDAMHQHFAEKRDAAYAEITSQLHDNWLPDFHEGKAPAIDGLLKDLQEIDWAPAAQDDAFLEGFFQKRVDNLTSTPYDMDQLQGDTGLHEFRRQLRWLSVYAVALDGKVTLPGADFDQLHKDPKAAVEYPAAPTYEQETIPFDFDLFKKNQALVQDFGLLKDRGELFEDLSHAFVEVGLGDMHQAEALLTPLLGQDHTVEALHKEAKAMYQAVQNAGHMDALKQAFLG